MKRSLWLFLALAVLAGGCGEEPKKDKDGDDPGKDVVVVIKTSEGTIKAQLFASKSPGTVRNFLAYVDEKHYDGTVFHRVISDFMIQGGGFAKGVTSAANPDDVPKYRKKTKASIKNEAGNGIRNETGTLAMARTTEPNSATDQFFINTKDNDFLDRAGSRDGVGYCVFGKVIDGMEVVEKIKKVKVKRGAVSEAVPLEEIVIESIRREE